MKLNEIGLPRSRLRKVIADKTDMLFGRLLRHIVKVGSLTVIDADDKTHVIGGSPGPSVTIRLHDPALHWKLFLNVNLYLGEAYMDGTLTVEDGDIYDFLKFSMANIEVSGEHPVMARNTREK